MTIFSGFAIAGHLIAHEEGTNVAYPLAPRTPGTMADQTFTLTWADSGDLPSTTTSAIDWYYTASMPPPAPNGFVPPDLIGQPIIRDVPEADDTNMTEWRTASVAAGNYWIYSILKDSHLGMPFQTVSFSRAPLTIAHAGDTPGPSITITPHPNPFAVGDKTFEIGFETFDPDGTGNIQIAAMVVRDGSDIFLIAENLPAVPQGKFIWETEGVPENLYYLRAVIRDAQGRSFTAFSRYQARIDHTPVIFDAGPRDSGDAPPVADTDCSCRSVR